LRGDGDADFVRDLEAAAAHEVLFVQEHLHVPSSWVRRLFGSRRTYGTRRAIIARHAPGSGRSRSLRRRRSIQ
jgi:hypothetical protein